MSKRTHAYADGRKGISARFLAGVPAVLLFLALAVSAARAGTIYFFKDENGVSHFSNVKLSEKYRPLYDFKEPAPQPRSAPQAAVVTTQRWSAPERPLVSEAKREEIKSIIRQISPRHGMDPYLVQAMVEVESNYWCNAISPKGAQGLMQIMPATQRDLGLYTPFDPDANIDAGIRYFKYLLQKFGSIRLALAAYNAGPGEVERCGGIPPIPETQEYVSRVLSKYLLKKFIQ